MEPTNKRQRLVGGRPKRVLSELPEIDYEVVRNGPRRTKKRYVACAIEADENVENDAVVFDHPDPVLLFGSLGSFRAELASLKEEFEKFKVEWTKQNEEHKDELAKVNEELAKQKDELAKVKEHSTKLDEELVKQKDEFAKHKAKANKRHKALQRTVQQTAAFWKQQRARDLVNLGGKLTKMIIKATAAAVGAAVEEPRPITEADVSSGEDSG